MLSVVEGNEACVVSGKQVDRTPGAVSGNCAPVSDIRRLPTAFVTSTAAAALIEHIEYIYIFNSLVSAEDD